MSKVNFSGLPVIINKLNMYINKREGGGMFFSREECQLLIVEEMTELEKKLFCYYPQMIINSGKVHQETLKSLGKCCLRIGYSVSKNHS